jgi:lactate dehydrogenase-like 2-hydroxyacid dehydrogenase
LNCIDQMTIRALITRPVDQRAIDAVAKHCDVCVHPIDEAMPPDLFMHELSTMDAVIPVGQRVTGEAIAAAPKLRIIANIGAGHDNIDLDACNARGIAVTNTPDVVSDSTADIAFALLLSTARRIVEGDHFVREGEWAHWQWDFLWGSDLHGKTLGLYGCGRIGQAMARRANGFSMRILYHARNRIDPAIENQLHAELVDRQTLLREWDFLACTSPPPRTPGTASANRNSRS